MRTLAILALCSIALPACQGPDGAKANPQRPTFSFSSATAEEGTFELQLGTEYDHQDNGLLQAELRYGTTENSEAYIFDTPYQWRDVSGGSDRSGRGVTEVGFRHRIWEQQEGTMAAAYRVAAVLPTGSRTSGFSDDSPQYFGSGTVDGKVSDLGWLAYYQYGSLADQTGGGRESQHGVAVQVNHPIGDLFGSYAELASIHTRARTDASPLFLFAGLNHRSNPSTVWDMGGRWGLNDDAETFALTAGVTFNLGGPGVKSANMVNQP